ncbi:MAG TPA: hypothetical protein VD994_03640 [Prosthecobacter sp.]|nr:hypothetical protein [Prosthecobacter sp.]
MTRLACLALLAAASVLPAAEFGLMQNMDGDLSFTGATPELSVTKLLQLIDDTADVGVNTLMQSIGAGSDILYYPTKVASTWGWRETKYSDDPRWKVRIQRCRTATDAGLDAPRIAGERCRERGLKFFPSYRMNDAHYCSDPLNYPLTGRFWMEHQDATIGVSPVAGHEPYRHLLNFARADVRAYRLAVIFEAIDRYADLMDGFELDFNRFQIFFPPGEAEANAHHITDFVRQVRSRLDQLAKQRGRQMTLVARVPPTLANCRWSGLAVADWMQEGLVDVVIPAQVMTLSHDMPIDEFVAAAKGTYCQIYGSIYGRSGYNWPFNISHDTAAYAAEVTRTPDTAQIFGAVLNQLHLGAGGIQLYNFDFLQSPMMTQVTAGLNDPAAILKGNRRYQVTQAYFKDHENGYEYRKQLPAALQPGKPLTLRLLIGEDLVKSAPAYAGLRIGLHGANQSYAGTSLTVHLNGRVLHEGAAGQHLIVTKGVRHGGGSHPPATEAHAQWPLADLSLLRAGWNDLTITLTSAPGAAGLQCVEAEIGVIQAP